MKVFFPLLNDENIEQNHYYFDVFPTRCSSFPLYEYTRHIQFCNLIVLLSVYWTHVFMLLNLEQCILHCLILSQLSHQVLLIFNISISNFKKAALKLRGRRMGSNYLIGVGFILRWWKCLGTRWRWRLPLNCSLLNG